jgi:hypothetical protein
MVLAFNVNAAVKRLVLGESWANRRMKAERFWLIYPPGRVLDGGRQLSIRLVGGIRRTRDSWRHEGGWPTDAIRADGERTGGASWCLKGADTSPGDNSSRTTPESRRNIYVLITRATCPDFEVMHPCQAQASGAHRVPTNAANQLTVDRGRNSFLTRNALGV